MKRSVSTNTLRNEKWSGVISLLLVIGTAGVIGFLAADKPAYRSYRQTALELRPVSDQILPSFRLQDQTGQTITQDDLLGKIWVAGFIFTRCDVSCPLITGRMAKVAEAFEENSGVKIISFSVDPAYDTVPILAEYAARIGANPNRWHFLTGSKDTIFELAQKFFFLQAGNVSDEDRARGAEDVLHSQRLVLINQEGRVVKYYDAAEEGGMNSLINDTSALLEQHPERHRGV